jgi:hypothetical protein
MACAWPKPDAPPDDPLDGNDVGADIPTFALDVARTGDQVAAQHDDDLRLGFDGYRRVSQTGRDVVRPGRPPARDPQRRVP